MLLLFFFLKMNAFRWSLLFLILKLLYDVLLCDMLCYNQRTVIFRMRRGCQSSDVENVRYYRLVKGSKCLPAPFQRKKQEQNLCR